MRGSGRGSTADVMVSGQSNLVEPAMGGDERERWNRMRDLLRALEDKHLLIRLLDRTRQADGIQVFLGAETSHTALSDSSVVAVSYGPEERPIGALAVIGPMRMNYGKVMSVVDFTADPARGAVVHGARFDDYCKVCAECVAACPLDLFHEVRVAAPAGSG